MAENANDDKAIAKRLSEIEEKLKKYTLIGTLAGVLLGGGGVLGAAQWMYKAPLEKKMMAYQSGMESLKVAMATAKESGDRHQLARLQSELISLDRSYRRALGLVAECMDLMAKGRTEPIWFQRVARDMRELQDERPAQQNETEEVE